jgi:hypothetical protein
MSTALSSAHTKMSHTRFNAGHLLPPADQFATLYFADDPVVGQFEVGAVLGGFEPGEYIPHPRKPFMTLNVDIILHEVVDLTDVHGAQIPLETSAQELTGDWRGYFRRKYYTPVSQPTGIAPTQYLGRELFLTAGVEGFRTLSAKMPWHKMLVVFPEKLHKGSSLKFYDQTGRIVHQIP